MLSKLKTIVIWTGLKKGGLRPKFLKGGKSQKEGLKHNTLKVVFLKKGAFLKKGGAETPLRTMLSDIVVLARDVYYVRFNGKNSRFRVGNKWMGDNA